MSANITTDRQRRETIHWNEHRRVPLDSVDAIPEDGDVRRCECGRVMLYQQSSTYYAPSNGKWIAIYDDLSFFDSPVLYCRAVKALAREQK